MGILKFFIAIILTYIFSPILFIYGTIANIKDLNTYYSNLALAKDKYGNVLGSSLFNKLLIRNDSNSYKYGDPDESISVVSAINLNRGTLKDLGYDLCNILIKLKDSAFNNK